MIFGYFVGDNMMEKNVFFFNLKIESIFSNKNVWVQKGFVIKKQIVVVFVFSEVDKVYIYSLFEKISI